MERPAAFADHFSDRAAGYAAFRPTYPAALFAHLARLTASHDLAWDCGTGNGQAALGLAEHFPRVLATDPSAAQLAHARPHPRIEYRQGREADSGLANGSADLVTAAQAFHWFDPDAFVWEARRVLRPGGVVAIWCYGLHTLGPELDPIIAHFYRDVVGPDWPPQRALVDSGYRDAPFPFDELEAPRLVIEALVDLHALLGYVDTWSAVRRHRARTGRDPLPDLAEALRSRWGDPSARRRAVWPLAMRVGRGLAAASLASAEGGRRR